MKTGIAKIGYFDITHASDNYTYGSIKWLESDKAGGREYKCEPRGESTDIYADSQVAYAIDSNDGYDITLTLLDIIDDIEEDWYGRTADAKGGYAEYAGGSQYPKFGLVIADNNLDGSYAVDFYYQCQVSKRLSRSGKTSEGKFDPQYKEFSIKALPREHDFGKKLVMYNGTYDKLPTAVDVPDAE